MARLVVGDPMLETTQVGPLATPVILHDLEEQVRRSVAAGARVLTGGHRLERPGNYYVPTVLVDVPEDSPAYREELFGPVAVVMRAQGIDAAIQTGQRYAVRARSQRVDRRCRRAAALHRGDRCGHGLHQRHGSV